MNSLFQDPQLIQQFLEIVKEGQAAPVGNVQDLARKLVNNLSRTMEGAISEITSETGAANVAIPNLSSLSALLKFLSDHKVAVDGKRIAYTGTEFASLPDEEKRFLGTITGETIQEVDNRPVGIDYWVNTTALADYLQHLQARGAKDEEMGNVQRGKLLQVMSGNLLQKIQHPNIGAEVSAEPKPAEAAPLSDATPVDSFGTLTFDERNPLADEGVAPGQAAKVLTLGDLKSRSALDNWLKQGTSYVVVYDAQGKHAVQYGTEGADPCPIIHVLFRRAQDKKNTAAGDPAKSRIADAYLQAIQNVSAQFTGLDGKPCSVSIPETAAPSPTETKPGEIKPGEMSQAQMQAIAHAVEYLPFEAGRINFGRFNAFFEQINLLPLPEAQDNLRQAQEAMAAATKLSGQIVFDLDEPVEQYAHTLKDPTTGQPTKAWAVPLALLLNNLMRLLFFTRKVIEAFWFRYGRRAPWDEKQIPAIERKVLGQIGKSPNDYSLYLQNYTTLHRQMPTAR